MKKIVGEILKNKNIEDNLKAYYGGFMEINNKYANIRLAMNYYTYYTMVAEDDGILQSENRSGITLINQIVENAANGKNDSLETDIDELEKLRKSITGKVQDLTCYVDRFNIYEHALNRVEYRFKQQDFPSGYSDENITRQLMQFILADEDNMAINRKISQVVGQLPVHFTKNKFFEMVSNGLGIYKGGTKESFQDFLYMIKTASMLEKTDTMSENYPYLEEMFSDFSKVSFKDISGEQYEEMSYNVNKVSEYIEEVMNSNMMIQEIINDLLIVLYTSRYRKEDHVVRACEEIIKDTNLLFLGKVSPKSIEEIEDMFVMLEGTQEELYPKISAYDITDQIQESYGENIEKLGLTYEYQIVFKLPKLNSDSMFVELDRQEDNSIADEAYIEREKTKLLDEYTELFTGSEKMIKRAVMSATLSELPVFFNNISELQDFIYDTLSICTDKAEKLACIEILNGIMEEE
ncbi:MAG: hypothetical protein ACLRZ9_04845 [Eubacterium sp.]